MQKLKLDHNFKIGGSNGAGRVRTLRERRPATSAAAPAESYRFRLLCAILVAVVIVTVLAATAARQT